MIFVSADRRLAVHPSLTNAALILIGTGLLLLTRQLIREFHHFTIGLSEVSGWSAILYLLAVAIILTMPVNRYTFAIILAFAVAFRLVTLFPNPYLSTDVYRYAWDGVVQHAHISPYRYVPGDPALTFLRTPNRDLFEHINRRDYAHTIYPPVAEMIFYIITFLSPTVTFMKAAMILFEGVTLVALLKLLRELGFRREQSLLYAWCPLLVWEIGSSGHLDSVAIAFIVLALLARHRRQPVLTGLFLGLAIMTKMYPLVLFPALFRRGEYKMPATVAAVIAIGYACYSSVGMLVFGFLGGYAKEEGIETGTRYFLLELAQHVPGLHSLSPAAYFAFAAVVFAGLILWCWRTCCNPARPRAGSAQTRLFGLPADADFLVPAFALALTLMLLFSPHYPWYVAWLVPFLAIVPDITVLAYVCGLFYLCTTAIAVGYGPQQFVLNEILYGGVLVAFLLDIAVRRRPFLPARSRPPVLGGHAIVNSQVSVIVPALNERESIGHVVACMPWPVIAECMVVDNGSTDGTGAIAAAAGARVITSPRGYGAACKAGSDAAVAASTILVFMDGDGSDVISDLPRLVAPIASGEADFVIGSRTRGHRAPGSMSFTQIFAGRVVGLLLRILHGAQYTDMGPFRAIRRSSLQQLNMSEMTYGWNLEMQVKAAKHGLRIQEIAVDYKCRIGGVSKVSGNLRASVRTGIRILAVLLRSTRSSGSTDA
jgi:hypothetical protein